MVRLGAYSRRRWIGIAVCAWAAAGLIAQGTATIEGIVRDAAQHPVAAATVYLKTAFGETRTAHTGENGSYRFTGLSAGSYTLRAESGVSGEANPRPITLTDGETRRIELAIKDGFYDEPNFIVAGVTDPSARGGHGSDMVLRSSESLAKSTAALAVNAPRGRNGTFFGGRRAS